VAVSLSGRNLETCSSREEILAAKKQEETRLRNEKLFEIRM
jgi:hypothetical protein